MQTGIALNFSSIHCDEAIHMSNVFATDGLALEHQTSRYLLKKRFIEQLRCIVECSLALSSGYVIQKFYLYSPVYRYAPLVRILIN